MIKEYDLSESVMTQHNGETSRFSYSATAELKTLWQMDHLSYSLLSSLSSSVRHTK